MPDDNVIRATTSVDTSGLQAGMVQANNIVANAAATLQASYVPAATQAATATESLTTAVNRIVDTLRDEGEALRDVVSNLNTGSRSLQAFGQHANTSGINIRYLIFGLKDIAEGRATFALAEGVNELIRLKDAALVAGLAVAGVAAVGLATYELGKLQGLWGGVTEAEKKANEELQKIDEQILHLNEHAAQTALAIDRIRFGEVFADTEEAANLQARITADKARQLSLQKQISEETVGPVDLAIAGVRALVGADPANSAAVIARKKNEEDLKKLGTQIYNEEEEHRKLMIEIGKKSLEDSLDMQNRDTQATNKAAADKLAAIRKGDTDALEDLRLKHASLGEQITLIKQEITEQSRYIDIVRTLKGELVRIQEEAARKLDAVARHGEEIQKRQAEADKKDIEHWQKYFDELENLQTEQIAKEQAHAAQLAEIRSRSQTEIGESSSKGAGQLRELQIERQKLEVQREMALDADRSYSSQARYLREIADLDSESRQAKIAGLQAEIATAQAALDVATAKELAHQSDAEDLRAVEDQATAMKKIVELQQQINELKQEDVNKTTEETTKALKAQEEEYQKYFDMIGQGFQNAFDSWITTGKNFKIQFEKAMREMVENIEKSLINAGLHKLFSLGENQLYKMLGIQTPNQQQQQQHQQIQQIENDTKKIASEAQKADADRQKQLQQASANQNANAGAAKQTGEAAQQFYAQQKTFDAQLLQAMQQIQQILQQIEQCDCQSSSQSSNPLSSIPVFGSILGSMLGSLTSIGGSAAGGAAEVGTAVDSSIEFGDIADTASVAALASGTDYVPMTGNYKLHQGEQVVPKAYNPNAGGNGIGHSFHFHQAPGASESETRAAMTGSFSHFKRMAKTFNR